jgi:putative transposase
MSSGGLRWGVEPICVVLEIAPSTYYDAKTRRPSGRAERDAELRPKLRALWQRNYSVYGRRKLTKAARKAGLDVGRDQVARLMRAEGIRGASRSKRRFTTHSDPAAVRAPDLLRRDFTATRPNHKWVADFTYCSTWSGVVYVAFVIDVFSRRIVGWKASRSMTAALVVDALNMAAWVRRGVELDGLICHSDAGGQYTSIAYTDHLDDIGAAPSIGTVGDSFDNAMAESVIGLFKTELHRNPRRSRPQRRALARARRPRDRHLRLGVMVQRRALPRRAPRLHPDRDRADLLPSPPSDPRGLRNQPIEPPGNPGRFS